MFENMAKQYIRACCCSMLEKKVKVLGSQHYNLISMINLVQMEFPSCIPYVGLNIVLNISRTTVNIHSTLNWPIVKSEKLKIK